MAGSSPTDDWEDVPVAESGADDWEDVPVAPPPALAAAPTRSKTTAGMAALRGAAQGASLGFIDELTAAVGAAKDSALSDSVDFPQAYQAWRGVVRRADKEAADDQPLAYGGAQAAAGLATAALPGVGALNPAARASLAARAGTAATAGGLAAAGESEAAPLESWQGVKDFAGDVATGVTTGAVFQGAIDRAAPVLTKAAAKVPGALKSAAERRAFKAAVGNQGKAYDAAVRRGSLNKVGRDLLDEGVVTFGSKARTIANRADEAREGVGKQMEELFSKIDETAPNSFSGPDVAADIRRYAEEIKAPNNKAIYKQLVDQADDFEAMGTMPMAEAQRLKDKYKWDARDPASMPIGKEATNRLNTILGKRMEQSVGTYAAAAKPQAAAAEQFGEVLKTGSGPSAMRRGSDGTAVLKEAEAAGGALDREQAAELYSTLKRKYGSMASSAKNAEKLANNQEKNRMFSLTDYIAGGVGWGSTMNPAAAAAAAAGNKGLRERGSSAAAVGMDKLADVLQASPQAFGKYAPVLQSAAARGNHALAVTHFLMSQQDPEYRRQVQGDE